MKTKMHASTCKLSLLIAYSILAGCQNNGAARSQNSIEQDQQISSSNQTSALSKGIITDSQEQVEATSQVSCVLNNGQTTTCYKFVFASNPVDAGPFCPETADDNGGLGIYDGATNPGLNALTNIFGFMEEDGYDIMDEDGYTRIQDPSAPLSNSGDESGQAFCLDAAANDSLTLTYLIPVNPVLLDSVDTIETVELFGFSLDGVPINGNPPSVVSNEGKPGAMGGGGRPSGPPPEGGMMGPPPGSDSNMDGGSTIIAIPALDPCGGHHDPAGYYHWHMVPEAANRMLEKNGITEVNCTNITQDDAAMTGYAKDGFPIYGPLDPDYMVPTDLDECNGHTAPTPEFPEGIYHYHALDGDAPGIPNCIKGASAVEVFSVE